MGIYMQEEKNEKVYLLLNIIYKYTYGELLNGVTANNLLEYIIKKYSKSAKQLINSNCSKEELCNTVKSWVKEETDEMNSMTIVELKSRLGVEKFVTSYELYDLVMDLCSIEEIV